MNRINGGTMLAAAMALAESAAPNPIAALRRMGYKVRAPKVPDVSKQEAAQAKRDRKNAKRAALLKRE